MNTSDHTTKRCIKCGKELPLTNEFWYARKDSPNGFRNDCKGCNRQQSLDYYYDHCDERKQYRIDNADHYREIKRKHRLANLDAEREYAKDYHARNLEKRRAYSRNYARAHKEQKKLYAENYKKDHPEQVKTTRKRSYRKHRQSRYETTRMYRNRKHNADGSHSIADVWSLFREQSGYCFHCGADLILIGFQRDHWIPLSRGGSDYIENIRLLCLHCNCSKGNKLPSEWHPEKYSPDD